MTAASLGAALARIGQVQPRLSGTTAVMLAIVATAAMLPGVWRVTRHITVIAHEGAHATVGSALGRTVNGISLRRNADGVTVVSGGGRPGSAAMDARILRDITRIPPGFWYGFWLLSTAAALVYGATLLV